MICINWSDKLDGSQLGLPSTMVVREPDRRTIKCVFSFGSHTFQIVRLIIPFWEKTQTLFPFFRTVYYIRTDKPSFPNGTSAAEAGLLHGISKTTNHLTLYETFGTQGGLSSEDHSTNGGRFIVGCSKCAIRSIQNDCKHTD